MYRIILEPIRNVLFTFCLIVSCIGIGSDSQVFQPSTFRSAQHKALYEIGIKYQKIRRQGGWPSLLVHPTGSIEVSDLNPQNKQRLAKRLTLTDHLKPRHSQSVSFITQKLKNFQRRHGLKANGKLTVNTIVSLNQPVSQKLLQINQALRQWETLPANLGNNFILINISNFILDVYQNKKHRMSFPVIVGEASADQNTPELEDEIEKIVFNPYWNVPLSIVHSEIIPNAKGRIEWYTSRNFELVKEYKPSAMVYGWSKNTLELFKQGKLRIRQRKGPKNTLGQIKFMLPNRHAIYLHDTPERDLFKVKTRAYSHGCVRVKRPELLATLLIQMSSPHWNLRKTIGILRSGKTQTVKLKNTVPIYIANFTVSVNSQGEIVFRKNVYGKLALNQ